MVGKPIQVVLGWVQHKRGSWLIVNPVTGYDGLSEHGMWYE